MKFHIYGQPTFVQLPKWTTIQDLRALAHLNCIIKNYVKMCKLNQD